MAGMTEPAPARDLFKGRHFDQDVIVLCVRWYLSFKLSSRNLVQMMSERGIVLAHIDRTSISIPSLELVFGWFRLQGWDESSRPVS
jgi:hypothetical protein